MMSWRSKISQDKEHKRELTCSRNIFHTHPIVIGSIPYYILGYQGISDSSHTKYPLSWNLCLDIPRLDISEHHISHPRHGLFVIYVEIEEFLDIPLGRVCSKESSLYEQWRGKRRT